MAKRIINNELELQEYLNEVFEGRFIADFQSGYDNHVHGLLDGNKIFINLWPHAQLIVSSKDRETLEKLKSALSVAMDDKGPMCKYDLRCYKDEDITFSSMEWDIVHPEDRLKKLVNGRGYTDGSEVLNLELLNGKEIADYIETEEEKEERKKTARIYGIDPGCIGAPEEANKLSEPELYLLISSLIDQIANLTIMKKRQGLDVDKDLVEIRYGLEYLIYQSTRFGVELEEPQMDRHILLTPSYHAWYNFWDKHFEEFTEQQFLAFDRLLKTGKDVSDFLPSGSWKDAYQRNMKPDQNNDQE